MFEVDYEAPLSPHRQIAAWLKARIESRELRPGQRIPTETDIVQLTGVARTTARRAIALLRDEELIFTVAGRGSYVAERGS